MNLLAAFGLTRKPTLEPVRFYAATKEENAAARSKRTELHLALAVAAAVIQQPRLLTPRELGDGKGEGARVVLKARKYGNTPTSVDGIRFASKAEANRYSNLRLLERAGEVLELRCQPRYSLVVNGHKVCTYVGDFAYLDRTGYPVTEDVKGVETDVFKVKAKLFRALMGRAIVVIK